MTWAQPRLLPPFFPLLIDLAFLIWGAQDIISTCTPLTQTASLPLPEFPSSYPMASPSSRPTPPLLISIHPFLPRSHSHTSSPISYPVPFFPSVSCATTAAQPTSTRTTSPSRSPTSQSSKVSVPRSPNYGPSTSPTLRHLLHFPLRPPFLPSSRLTPYSPTPLPPSPTVWPSSTPPCFPHLVYMVRSHRCWALLHLAIPHLGTGPPPPSTVRPYDPRAFESTTCQPPFYQA